MKTARKYLFSKAVEGEGAENFLKEMREVEGLESIEITEDAKHMIIVAADDKYTHVLNRAVSIIKRVAGDPDIRFDGFVVIE